MTRLEFLSANIATPCREYHDRMERQAQEDSQQESGEDSETGDKKGTAPGPAVAEDSTKGVSFPWCDPPQERSASASEESHGSSSSLELIAEDTHSVDALLEEAETKQLAVFRFFV